MYSRAKKYVHKYFDIDRNVNVKMFVNIFWPTVLIGFGRNVKLYLIYYVTDFDFPWIYQTYT